MNTIRWKLALSIITGLLPLAGFTQTYDTNNVVVQTFAGSAFYGYLDGQGQETMFSDPTTVVSDSKSNLYVWDGWPNMRIRKIGPDATVTTFVGGGNQGTGVGTNVSLGNLLNGVVSMAVDRNDTIWLANEDLLYKITSNATVSLTNLATGPISGMCLDSNGKIYLSIGNKIYQYISTNGSVSVFVGSGNSGAIDGNGVFTSFNYPRRKCCLRSQPPKLRDN
jgi:hypothetical protein